MGELNALRRSRTRTPVRERIVAAAQRCFDEVGVGKTTMEDISAAAGVTRRTVYKYFPSKETIISDVVAQEIARLDARIARIVAGARSLAEALTESLVLSTRALQRASYLRDIFASGRVTSLAVAPQSVLHRQHSTRWASLLATFQASGELAPDLSAEDAIGWLILANYILLSRDQAVRSTAADLRRFIRTFIVAPLLADPRWPLGPDVEAAARPVDIPRIAFERRPAETQAAHGPGPEMQILRAAYDCFKQQGVKSTTLGDVASRASVSRRTLYRYFADKEDLVGRLTIALSEQVNVEIRARVDRRQSFEGVLTDCLVLAVKIVAANPQVWAFADEAYWAGPADPSAPAHDVIRAQWSSLLDGAARRGVLAPELEVDEVVSWLYLAQAMLHSRFDAIAMEEAELRRFIRRFIVAPLLG